MDDVKINLTMVIPGAIMVSEQECSRQLKKPITNRHGKQLKDKEGNLLYEEDTIPNLSKLNKHTVKVTDEHQRTKDIVYYTRKVKKAKQVINITKAAYDYYISNEVPFGYKKSWKSLSKEQKIAWHLNAICEELGGQMVSYVVFED